MITNQNFNKKTVQLYLKSQNCTLLQIIDKILVNKQHQSPDVDKQTVEI